MFVESPDLISEVGRVSDPKIDVASLLQRLAQGWTAEHTSEPAAALRLLAHHWEVEPNESWISPNAAVANFPLNSIRLRNFGDLWVVLLGGASFDSSELASLKAKARGSSRQVMVLATSDEAYLRAEPVFPAHQEFLTLEPAHVAELLSAECPLEYLKAVARRRLSRYHLNPFGTLTVPGSNMFAGRRHELQQLIHSQAESFAIAGPGRIGKSSLLQHFHLWLQRNDPARFRRSFLIDLYTCDATQEESICRDIALPVNQNKRAFAATPDSLERFLRREAKECGGPIELLLDEVDEVVDSTTFNKLVEAAKNRHCRVILCGKHKLFEAMHTENHVLRNRLTLMPLEPLKTADLHGLFTAPLRDLGFEMRDEEKILEQVEADTGGYPHLIQYYGRRLVDHALKCDVNVINYQLFSEVQNAYETLQTFAGPVLDIKEPEEEMIALNLLRSLRRPFTEDEVRKVAGQHQVEIDEKKAARICRRLYINNVFAWLPTLGRYQIANQALSRAATKLGFLAPRFVELDKLLTRRKAAGKA